MHRSWIWLCLALGAQAPAATQEPGAAQEPGRAPVPRVEARPLEAPAAPFDTSAPLVGLHQLFADPLAYLGREVRVVFQLQSSPERWNPYLTRFGTADWVAVNAWAEHQFLWDVREYEHPLGLLFAPRGGPEQALLASAGEFARFEARLRVDQVFLGRPWMAILDLRRLRAETGRGTILHASRAIDLMASGEWRLAMDDLSRSRVPDLPPAAETELDRLRAYCEDRLAELRASNQSRGR